MKKLTLLKFKWNFCLENNSQAAAKKKDAIYMYNIFIKHLAEHFLNSKRDDFKEKNKRMIFENPTVDLEVKEVKEIATKVGHFNIFIKNTLI